VTRLLLIRHAAIDGLGQRIAGRSPGNPLNRQGRSQAAQLADSLGAQPIAAIYSSPQSRTMETAEALAQRAGIQPIALAELDELDFGSWAGHTYAELHELPEWRLFNKVRSITRMPGGELLLEVQCRVIACIDRLRRCHDGATVALVSHGDVIRAALLFYLGAPLDSMLRLEISPASVSTLVLDDSSARILQINRTFTAAEELL
jgi:probable phosphoglycerate mutase